MMMKRNAVKKVVLMFVLTLGQLGFGGCLGVDLTRVLGFGAAFTASEFLFDNDGVFDLFESGNVAGL